MEKLQSFLQTKITKELIMLQQDFLSEYLTYTQGNECPATFHRWCGIVGVGAQLGRNFYMSHGHFKIYPNIYALLIGGAGTKKSTGINILRKLLQVAGYERFAPKKITKEKFLVRLAESSNNESDILDTNLFGDSASPAEIFVAAGEFTEFFGNDILSFCSMLGEMWDWEGKFENEVKNSSDSIIYDPTISLIGGTTPATFSNTFPTGIIGQGFFSRLLMIHTHSNRPKLTWPEEPDTAITVELASLLIKIKTTVLGKAELTHTTKNLLDKIYKSWEGIDDTRFESYANRRFTHLLKLCLVCAASRLSVKVEEQDVIYANTILSHAEHFMPAALGEFGKAKNSDIAHKVITVLNSAHLPLTFKDIWIHVSNDLESPKQLQEILSNLLTADKAMTVDGKFLPKKKILEEISDGMVNYELLTQEERMLR